MSYLHVATKGSLRLSSAHLDIIQRDDLLQGKIKISLDIQQTTS